MQIPVQPVDDLWQFNSPIFVKQQDPVYSSYGSAGPWLTARSLADGLHMISWTRGLVPPSSCGQNHRPNLLRRIPRKNQPFLRFLFGHVALGLPCCRNRSPTICQWVHVALHSCNRSVHGEADGNSPRQRASPVMLIILSTKHKNCSKSISCTANIYIYIYIYVHCQFKYPLVIQHSHGHAAIYSGFSD